MTEAKTCPSCGENLTGNFCANCGQKVKNLNVPFKEIVSEVVDNILTFDSKFFRSLIPLITKPGFLTLEYNLGRRASYVTPFKLYLFISLILFFMLTIIDVKIVKFDRYSTKSTELSTPAADSLETADPLKLRIARKLAQSEENIEQINTMVVKRLPQLMFVLMPVFALLLKLLYRRSEQFYLSHLIFAIHFHAFVFLVFIVALLIYITSELKLSSIFLVFIPIYLFQCLKRVYSEGFWVRLIKSFVLVLIYVLILGSSLSVLAFIAVLLV